MFTASEVCKILGLTVQIPAPAAVIKAINIDSRQISDGQEVCFLAIKGLRHDGHHFLEQVWHSGVRNFIVQSGLQLPALPDSNVFVVPDTIRALQQLAAAHRAKFSLPCIGITGSNGKTWVKEWLYQLMSPDQYIVKSPRSYNSQIGAPLSVLHIRSDHTLGIFEAGISKKGEMTHLAEVIKPDMGILTHMGDAHQAGFGSMEEN